MTREEQRIAIAEAVGWKRWDHSDVMNLEDAWSMHEAFVLDPFGNPANINSIPAYLNDLNAIHEAEKLLTDEQAQVYFDNLSNVTGARLETLGVQYGVCHFKMYNATAAHRAEAFLKTLSLWKD